MNDDLTGMGFMVSVPPPPPPQAPPYVHVQYERKLSEVATGVMWVYAAALAVLNQPNRTRRARSRDLTE